ncbi:MAG TPA: hypothetical protein EYH29_01445 [Caldilineales bacterium]|nr:hypothetical protein [Caldilineales bacterium]
MAAVDDELANIWKQLLRAMRRINPKLQAMLRSGEPVAIQDGKFYIRFRYEFHQNQVRAGVDDLNKGLSQVLGGPMEAVVLGENESPPASTESNTSPDANPNPGPHPHPDPASSLTDHPVVRRAVDRWGGKVQ